MDIKELLTAITNVGFPVVVSAFLLVKLEKQLDSLNTSITKLTTIIETRLGISCNENSN
ncbi:MAG: YvrJ family protein [Clostridiaceae bacterium]|nr:YvrJ family protein [Clostridiaceae bacterium]